MNFGESLQALRKECKVTQEQLANYLGVSAQAVSKWENGSFPEGDLIPKIADYFKVSIDYLYGREGRRATTEQQIVNELSAIWREGGTQRELQKKFMDKVHRLLWGLQIGSWKTSCDYYERPVNETADVRMSSAITFDEGFSYMRLDKNKECYLFLRKPEEDLGFERWFRDTTDVRKFFGMMADQDNLRVIGFLYTLGIGELATLSTIEKVTCVAKEKIVAFLDYMTRELSQDGEHVVMEVQLVGNDGENQKAYGVNMALGGLFVGIFALADSYVHPPQGYTMQNTCKEHSWADRSKLTECR
ncbi:MAG: helix-turn-helix transcriptional regulator [Lachnospiraceae bacterium]|nr:helix-turn-helix transcriptional regulator [Lachnospiraceae bacterium]